MSRKKTKIFLFALFSFFIIIVFLQNPEITGKIIKINSNYEDYLCENCNVILISIDTLRADHLSCYGYEKSTSPNIDKFASESILFKNAYSTTAWTFPSHYSIFTSKYPNKENIYIYNKIKPFDKSDKTITEILKNNNYKTAAFTGGGFVNKELGFGRGFDIFKTNGRRIEDNINDLFNWIEKQNTDEKFFLFIHGFNTHSPYNAPKEFNDLFVNKIPEKCAEITFDDNIEKETINEKQACLYSPGGADYAKSRYDAEIAYVDSLIKEIFDKLKQKNLYNNSIIIITSDHGEEFLEHGKRDHVKTLYQELIKVPLIIKLPNSNLQEKKIEKKVSNIQIFPTLLAILNIRYNENLQENLFENNENHIYTLTGKRFVDSEGKETGKFVKFATIDKNNKLIITIDDNKKTYEIYDLKKDPEEKKNLINISKNEIKNKLENDINSWLKKIDFNSTLFKNEYEFNQETLEQLKSLGYM